MKKNNRIQWTWMLVIASAAIVLAPGCSQIKSRLGGEQTEAGHDDHGHEEEAGGHEEEAGGQDEHGHGGEQEEVKRGLHGGKMLESDLVDLEITIFETGVPPEYRVYATRSGETVPPGSVDLKIQLNRFGGRTDSITFAPEGDYLRSQQTIEEPHSFEVEVSATLDGGQHSWEFDSFEGRTEFSAQSAREAGVETMTASPGKATATLTLPGEVTLNKDRLVHVVPRMSGFVKAVHKVLGDTVVAGEVLAIIDSKELADAKSEYLAAIERRDLAQSRYTMENDLFAQKISPQQDLLEARQSLAEASIAVRAASQKLQALGVDEKAATTGNSNALTEYELRSPIDGTVIEKHLTLGEVVKDDADGFVLADLSVVWVDVIVYAADLRRVKVGQEVTVRSEDLDLSSTGTISYIGDVVGQANRTARAIVQLPNPDRVWKPGLYVSVEVAEGEIELALAVPEAALQTFRDWDVIFLTDGEIYQAQPVELGRRVGGWAEVLSGLKPGDTYVSANSYLIKADIEKAGAAHDH